MTEDEKIAHHELAHKTMTEAQDYIGRGRHLRGLSICDLKFEFVSSVQLVACDGNDNANRVVMHDVLAEFDLRGAEPPYHLVKDETRVMAERGRLERSFCRMRSLSAWRVGFKNHTLTPNGGDSRR